jgi:hypothetical protein
MSAKPKLFASGTDGTKPWPFATDSFDRSAILTDSEMAALAIWVEAKERIHARYLKIQQPLQRLIQPLTAALDHFGLDTNAKFGYGLHLHRTTVGVILFAMHQRQTSFWAWEEEEWMKLVGETTQEYEAYGHSRKPSLRRPLLACAYLLYNPKILLKVRDLYMHLFAKAIFGNAPMQKAITSVKAEAARIGLGKAATNIFIPLLTYEALLLNYNPVLNALLLPVLQQLQVKYQEAAPQSCGSLSRVLHNLRIIPRALKRINGAH